MKRINTVIGSLLAFATGAMAAVPFQTTTVNNGEFAAGTVWYTMQIGAGAMYLTAPAADTPVEVGTSSTLLDDNDLWCFTGDETTGFTIYNKATGAGMSLAAPTNPAAAEFGANGQTAYTRLIAPGAEGFSYLWSLTPSANIEGTYYFNLTGNSTAILNNRDSKLAFWTAGKDAGSSIRVTPKPEVSYTVTDNVWTLQDSPLVTLSAQGGTATYENGVMKLSAGQWQFTMPDDKALDVALYTTADGTEVTLDGYPYEGNSPVIEGPVEISNFSLLLTDRVTPSDHGYAIFRYDNKSPKYSVVYRIPAIACIESGEHAGRLIAVNDYRYCGGDIGAGRIDLHMSISDDNGKTWSKPDHMRNAQGVPVAKGTGAPGNVITNLDCGFGDPAIVTDRETGEILVVACCGRMNFFSSRRDNPQPSARWWSQDGGKTWTEPDYGQWEQIYALFDDTCVNGYIDGQFVGSGRMVQSKYIKVDKYYRIYAVMSGQHAASGNISNWVLYSDDFGRNWHVLGDPMNPACPSNADEPKCEELPDGSILLAARANGGNRNFNVFRYTDPEKAEGSWGTVTNTNMGMGGINACNGEIMILPVANKETGAKHYLALQSFPYGGGRNNVSIAWKALVEPADYESSAAFANWGGRYQVSTMGSAYSTMCFQSDNKIGFLYEEATFGVGYTEIYMPLTIEEITGGKFEYSPDTDGEVAKRMTTEMMNYRVQAMTIPGKYVGTPVGGIEPVKSQAAIAAYGENPSIETIAAFNRAIVDDMSSSSDGGIIMPKEGAYYHIFSAHDGAYTYTSDRYLSVSKSSKKISTGTKANQTTTVFQLVRPEGDSENFLIYNPNAKAYLPSTASALETEMNAVTEADKAAPYSIQSDITGHTSLVCTTPGIADKPALHLKSTGGTVVVWTIDAGGSKWYMEQCDYTPEEDSAISEIGTTDAPVRYYDLQGREVATPVAGELYITSDHSKIIY